MKYKVGEVVYKAYVGRTEVHEVCDTCFGNKEVEMILGNGEHILLECKACAVGFGSPTGLVHGKTSIGSCAIVLSSAVLKETPVL